MRERDGKEDAFIVHSTSLHLWWLKKLGLLELLLKFHGRNACNYSLSVPHVMGNPERKNFRHLN